MICAGVPRGRWAFSGHSLGGAAATTYVVYFGNKVYGAVLHSGGTLGIRSQHLGGLVLQMYGSLDDLVGGNNSYEREILYWAFQSHQDHIFWLSKVRIVIK